MPWPQWRSRVAVMIVTGVLAPCQAQQPNGSATLADLLSTDAEASTAAHSRLAGTLVRPEDGVRHQTLDDAWAAYDAAVAKATSAISEKIAKEFDAATAKGDLAAAEKWQSIGARLEKDGAVRVERATKAVAYAALNECLKAADELAGVYGSLVKDLTREQKIPEAEAVRLESLAVVGAGRAAWEGGHPMLLERALRFDGKRGVVEVPHIPLDQFPAFTIEFWTKGWSGVVLEGGKAGDPENLYSMRMGDAFCTCVFESGRGKNIEWNSPVAPGGKISHVAWVSCRGESVVYFNGKQVDRREIPAMGALQRDRPLLLGAVDHAVRKEPKGSGLLYALRISKVVRYFRPFKPQRDWTVDEHTVLQFHAANAKDRVLPDESRNKLDAVVDTVPTDDVPMEIPAARN